MQLGSGTNCDWINLEIAPYMATKSGKDFVLGGRVSDSIAGFLSANLKQIRPKVHHVPANREHWPDLLLTIRKQDVVVLFDFRRCQRDLEVLAEIVAREGRPTIVLITDKWMSPIARYSDHVVALPIEIQTAWDTFVCVLAFVEAFPAADPAASPHFATGGYRTCRGPGY